MLCLTFKMRVKWLTSGPSIAAGSVIVIITSLTSSIGMSPITRIRLASSRVNASGSLRFSPEQAIDNTVNDADSDCRAIGVIVTLTVFKRHIYKNNQRYLLDNVHLPKSWYKLVNMNQNIKGKFQTSWHQREEIPSISVVFIIKRLLGVTDVEVCWVFHYSF